MVEGTGFENRQARKGLVGSNPTSSANFYKKSDPIDQVALCVSLERTLFSREDVAVRIHVAWGNAYLVEPSSIHRTHFEVTSHDAKCHHGQILEEDIFIGVACHSSHLRPPCVAEGIHEDLEVGFEFFSIDTLRHLYKLPWAKGFFV